MKPLSALNIMLLCSGMIWSSCATQKALWIDVREHGEQKTIAVTEGIAKKLLDSKDINFTKGEEPELVTRAMLQSVLEGRERSVTARGAHGSEATFSLRPLTVPGEKSGNKRIVLETYKNGEQTFRFTFPEFDFEIADEKGDVSVHANVDWKEWLPYLAKEGGAVYLKDHEDDTEVWLYVE